MSGAGGIRTPGTREGSTVFKSDQGGRHIRLKQAYSQVSGLRPYSPVDPWTPRFALWRRESWYQAGTGSIHLGTLSYSKGRLGGASAIRPPTLVPKNGLIGRHCPTGLAPSTLDNRELPRLLGGQHPIVPNVVHSATVSTEPSQRRREGRGDADGPASVPTLSGRFIAWSTRPVARSCSPTRRWRT